MNISNTLFTSDLTSTLTDMSKSTSTTRRVNQASLGKIQNADRTRKKQGTKKNQNECIPVSSPDLVNPDPICTGAKEVPEAGKLQPHDMHHAELNPGPGKLNK